MVFPPHNSQIPKLTMNTKNKVIKQVQHKKVIGIIVDGNLGFNLHIQERKNKGFKAFDVFDILSTLLIDVP